MGLYDQLKHAWNAFTNQDDRLQPGTFTNGGGSYSSRPDRPFIRIGNERSIVTSIYARIAVDFSTVDVFHVRLDEWGRYLEDMNSGLQNCLTVEPNLDQAPNHFKRDLILSMFESMDGTIAVVPVDTNVDPNVGGFDIETMRIGRVTKWFPRHVVVDLYNDRTGRHEEVPLLKSSVALIENPLSTVMNSPNSTLQRLIRKLAILDAIDEQSGSGKLDLLIQLPYVIKTEARREQAEKRRKDIEFQLKGSQYGIAYTDGTEKITQLNRPAENNLLQQIEYLTAMVYGQLGITEEVMNGTADEKVMLNYMNRTIEPLWTAVVEEFRRKFLTKTARTQRQSVLFYLDPFKLIPLSQIAEIADKFSRNEIMSSNELRQAIGRKPSKDPKADELRNSNMPAALDQPTGVPHVPATADEVEDEVEDPFTQVNKVLDEVFASLEVEG